MSETQPPSIPLRQKRDAEAQTGGESSLPQTPVKRVRCSWFQVADRQEAGTSRVSKNVVMEISSPSGQRIVHINTDNYNPRAVDVVTETWVSSDDVRYLYKLLCYHNKEGVWFPIEFVPPNSTWAVVDENPRLMHRTYRGHPLLIWIIGVFAEGTLAVTRTEPRPRMRAVVDFVRERDRAAVLLLHNKEASVALTGVESLTVMSPVNDDEGVPAHDEVYDCRGSFSGKNPLNKISLGQIEGGDIVMIECTLVRTEAVTGSKTVTFMLNSLYWLLQKPRPPVVITQPQMKFTSTIASGPDY